MSKKNPKKDEMKDWIASLASAVSQDALPSKSERKRKREAKKRRRGERVPSSSPPLTLQSPSVAGDVPKPSERSRTKKRLRQLAEMLAATVSRESSEAEEVHRRPRVYRGDRLTEHFRKRQWDLDHIQPRACDYGGIGLARPSLYLSNDDPSFLAKLEEEFLEHIPGFFGKQRTKAMKKQLNGNMLWRKLADKKVSKINGQKLDKMTPDERVEAMIKAGMV